MLIGEYLHSIDAKKRLSIPSKMRKELGRHSVITKGLDNCLYIYPLKEWQALAQKLSSLPAGQSSTRSFTRLMLSGASEVDTDGLGRILVPDYLKQYADLKKNVVVIGLYNHLEIWDKEKWEKYRTEAEKSKENIAEKLGEAGTF